MLVGSGWVHGLNGQNGASHRIPKTAVLPMQRVFSFFFCFLFFHFAVSGPSSTMLSVQWYVLRTYRSSSVVVCQPMMNRLACLSLSLSCFGLLLINSSARKTGLFIYFTLLGSFTMVLVLNILVYFHRYPWIGFVSDWISNPQTEMGGRVFVHSYKYYLPTYL